MALQGRLQELPASEVLGLIGRQEKSGRLEARVGNEVYVLYFERGLLVQGREPAADPNDSFIALLKELRILSSDHMSDLSAWQSANPELDPVEHLTKKEITSKDQLRSLILIHAQGIVEALLEAKEGTFVFESALVGAPFALPLAEKVEFMMMEAGRRSDETSLLITSEIPLSAVPFIRPGQRPMPSDPITNTLLRHIDGKKSVADLVASSELPRTEIIPWLKSQMDGGVCSLRIVGTALSGGRGRKGRKSSAVSRPLVLAGIVGLIVLSVLAGFELWTHSFGVLP
jgi:hypothetical protein